MYASGTLTQVYDMAPPPPLMHVYTARRALTASSLFFTSCSRRAGSAPTKYPEKIIGAGFLVFLLN